MFHAGDSGCWAEGGLGHRHVRDRMASLLTQAYRHDARWGDGTHWPVVSAIVMALEGEMSDDAWEEDAAIFWLNRHCLDDCCFEMVDGDLMLLDLNPCDEEE